MGVKNRLEFKSDDFLVETMMLYLFKLSRILFSDKGWYRPIKAELSFGGMHEEIVHHDTSHSLSLYHTPDTSNNEFLNTFKF